MADMLGVGRGRIADNLGRPVFPLWLAILLLCLWPIAGAASAQTVEGGPRLALRLGLVTGGDAKINKAWKANSATKAFNSLIAERIDNAGADRLDVELESLSFKHSGLLIRTTDSVSVIRYRVTGTDGRTLYDRRITVTYSSTSKDSMQLSLDPAKVQGFGENMRRSIGQFFQDYAAALNAPRTPIVQVDASSSVVAGQLVTATPRPAATTPLPTGAAAAMADFRPPSFEKLVPGQKVVGRLPGGGNATLCYTLDTQPGQTWLIQFYQKGNLGPDRIGLTSGENCPSGIEPVSDGVERRNSTTGDYGWYTLAFVSGGGPYILYVRPSGPQKYTTSPSVHGTLGDRRLPTLAELRRDREIRERRAAKIRSFGQETHSPTASQSPNDTGQARRNSALRDCPDICPEMVVVPAGTFLMGSNSAELDRQPNEGPQHRVTIRNAFAMGKYEVTGAEWDACVADGACAGPPSNAGRRPAIADWTGARAYADWLSTKTGQRYFLPSEAEWEYAARAGADTPWNTGDAIITDDANMMDQFRQAVPVGGFPANAFGLHDMHGNVAEWTLDCLDVGYFGVPTDGGAAVTANCAQRVVRGGNWADMPKDVRSAARRGAAPAAKAPGIGFRVARAFQ